MAANVDKPATKGTRHLYNMLDDAVLNRFEKTTVGFCQLEVLEHC